MWRSEPDFGIYNALNKAIKLSRGEYYLVAGADDVLESTAVANYKAWLCGAATFITWHFVGTVFRKSLHDRKQIGLYSRSYPITADSVFVKRAVGSGARGVVGNFLARHIGGDGVSSADVAGGISEIFRFQLATERDKGIQVALFVLRLLRNFRRQVNASSKRS